MHIGKWFLFVLLSATLTLAIAIACESGDDDDSADDDDGDDEPDDDTNDNIDDDTTPDDDTLPDDDTGDDDDSWTDDDTGSLACQDAVVFIYEVCEISFEDYTEEDVLAWCDAHDWPDWWVATVQCALDNYGDCQAFIDCYNDISKALWTE